MAVAESYEETVLLPRKNLTWAMINDLGMLLHEQGLVRWGITTAGTNVGQASADSPTEMAEEYPDPTQLSGLTVSYRSDPDWSLKVIAMWTRGGAMPPYANVIGPNEADVLDVAGVIDRFTQKIEPGVGTPAAAEHSASRSEKRTERKSASAPFYKQPLLWEISGVVVAVAALVVTVLLNT